MTIDMVDFLATPSEQSLIADLDEIGFGEIYQAEFKEGDRKTIRIDRKIKDALLAIRAAGKVQKAIIHESRITMIEYRTTAPNSGLRCLKKMKF